jgi:guanidinobutyrase / D-arginase
MERAQHVGQVDAQNVPRFVGFRTFARLPRLEDVGSADAAVLGAPIDLGTTFRSGPRFGPAAIREASLLLKPYSEPLDVFPFDDMQVADAGDAPASPIDITAAHATIEQGARELHERGIAVIGLGGDHSVALPLLRAAAATHGTLSLLQLDSHTDTWDSYFGGHKVTNGTIFRRAIEEDLIDPGRSVQIGLRGGLYSGGDYRDNRDLGFKTLLARELDRAGIDGALLLAHEHCILPTYVTLDIDVLDPAFAPGTGTPEVGGMTTRELLGFLRGLTDLRAGIAAGDVVEVSPPYDPSGITALAGANLAWELLCLLAHYRGRSS